MKDANESYLDQHQSDLAKSDNAQDWKDDYIDELTREGGEYYPFKRSNMIEALVRMSNIKIEGFKELSEDAAHNGEEHFGYFLDFMDTVSEEYWKEAAAKRADADYDKYFNDRI